MARADHVNSTGRLTVATRAVLVLIGTATIGAAVVAMFKRDGDVVPTSLIVVGAVFVVLGGLGRQVDSVSIKDGGLTYSQWRDEVLENGSPAAVLETATSAPPPVRIQFREDPKVINALEAAYELSVGSVLQRHFRDRVQRVNEPKVNDGDFIIQQGDKMVLVATSFSPMNNTVVVDQAEDIGATGVVLISATKPKPDVLSQGSLKARRAGMTFQFEIWDALTQDSRDVIAAITFALRPED